MLKIKSDKILPLIIDGLLTGVVISIAYIIYRIFKYIC